MGEERKINRLVLQEKSRKKYLRHAEKERASARIRAARTRATESPEQAEARKGRHRAAQARYRAANRLALKLESWQYRHDKKWKAAKLQEDIEYQEFITLHPELALDLS